MYGAKPGGFNFGSGSSFGTTSPFGQSSTAFGTPSAFGTQTQPATGGMFGATATTVGNNLFGQQSSTFGLPSSAGFSFGSTPNTSAGLFGQQSTSLFSTPLTTNAFGSKPAGSAFGGFGTSTTSSSGVFGRNQNPSSIFGQSSGSMFVGSGTGTSVKFMAPSGQDTMVKGGVSTSINTRHQCITAMKEYENKSLEELRQEDYQVGRKGKQQQQPQQQTGLGLFSPAQPAQSTTGFGSFGQNKTTGFGTGGFGSTGSAGTGLFGQSPAAQSGTGLFGQSKPLFGSTTSANTTGFTFNNPTATTGTSLFGQNPQQQTKGLFGTPASTQSGLYGSSTSTFGSTGFGTPGATGFGTNPQGGGLFGSKPIGFGTPTTTNSFGFGQTTGTNLFAKPVTTSSFSFGTNTSTAGFSANTGGGLFGNKPLSFNPAGSLIGGSSTFSVGNANNGTAGGIFGNTQKHGFGFNIPTNTGGGFSSGLGGGTGLPFNLGGNTSTLGSNTMSSSSAVTDYATLQKQLEALVQSPYGDSSLFWNLKETKVKTEDILRPTNPEAQKALLSEVSQYKVSPRPINSLKPKTMSLLTKNHLFDDNDDDDFGFDIEAFTPKRSIKKLDIRSLNNSNSSNNCASPFEKLTFKGGFHSNANISVNGGSAHKSKNSSDDEENTSPMRPFVELPIRSPRPPNKDRQSFDTTIAELNVKNKSFSPDSNHDDLKDENESPERERDGSPPPPHPAGIVMTRPGYYTVPNVEELGEMVDENGDCFVCDFTLGREGYGSLYFPGITNIAGLNIDDLVHFRKKEVTVYPDDEHKPAEGQGLNKKAEVTLDCVWPVDKSSRLPIKDPERIKLMKYEEKLENNTIKIGGKFIDYRPETGSWVFEVKHFSKYGLLDDSDDEHLTDEQKEQLKLQQQQKLAVQKQKVQSLQTRFDGVLPPQQQQVDDLLAGMQQAVGIREMSSRSLKDAEVHPAEEDDEMPDIGKDMEADKIQEPTSHRLAMNLGINAQDVQMMKASFFLGDKVTNDDVEDKLLSAHKPFSIPNRSLELFQAEVKKPCLTSVKHGGLLVHTLLRDQGRETREAEHFPREVDREHPMYRPMVEHTLLEMPTLLPPMQLHRLIGSRIQRNIPDSSESLLFRKQHLIMDAGCFMGRSFRVGWGPGWTLVHSGHPVTTQIEAQIKENTFSILHRIHHGSAPQPGCNQWKVTLEKLQPASHLTSQDKAVMEHYKRMLEVQLTHSRNTTEGDCPLFVPAMGVAALHQYAAEAETILDEFGAHPDVAWLRHSSTVWDLCVALWGNLPEYAEDDVIDKNNYHYHQARKEAFSRWLSQTAASQIKEEVEKVKFMQNGYLLAILSQLSGKQISEACMTAEAAGDYRLALLLAQATGSHVSRQMMEKQLIEWAEYKVDEFILPYRMKIFALLSGNLVWSVMGRAVNTCENVGWKRALALHLWFDCKPSAFIAEALQKYDASQSGEMLHGKYTKSPLPPYLEDEDDACRSETNDDDLCTIKDTCYHLLQLYCDKSYRLERTLSSTAATPNHLDYRLSWHLCQVLQSLGYKHLSIYQAASFSTSFAAQLEAVGLWEWALFVVMHIEDARSREAAIKHILNKHIVLSKDLQYLEKERFIQEQLLVPPEWVHYAKALRARHENLPHDEAWHLLKARRWNESHQVVLHHIAAEAIINETHNYLLKYLNELALPERSSTTILDWETGGSVYLNYINLCKTLTALKKGCPSFDQLEKLKPKVTNLCSKVGSLTCWNSKDRLCQSEMAKSSANLLQSLLTMQGNMKDAGSPVTEVLAPHISNLPMPEDYSIQEMRTLIRCYTMEMVF